MSKRALAPILESAGMVAALVAVNLVWFRDRPGLVDLSPHPTLFVTLFVLARYGFAAGLWAAAICTLGYGLTLFLSVEVPSSLHLLAAPYSTPIVVLVPTAVVLGTVVERHLERVRTAAAREKEAAAAARKLESELARLREVNVGLAGKVVGADATLQRLYRYAKVLNVNDVQEIYRGLVRMIAEVLEVDVVSVWDASGSELRLVARRGQGDDLAPFRLDSLVAAQFDAHGILALHDVPETSRYPGLPYLVGRISSGRDGPVAAYLTIDRLSFALYNAETIRFFTLATDWASHSVGNALDFERRTPASVEAPADGMALDEIDGAALAGVTAFSTDREARDTILMSAPVATASPAPATAPVALGVLLAEVDRLLSGEGE